MILETAAIAIGTIIATKALEKTTEKVTESLVDLEQFSRTLQKPREVQRCRTTIQ
jgi:ribosomal protein L18